MNYLDRKLSLWAKIVTVAVVIGLSFFIAGYVAIRFVPEDEQPFVVIVFLLLAILRRLEDIRRKL